MPKDILVETSNPEFLDQSLRDFGAAVVGGGMPGEYTRIEGAYIVRCLWDDYIGFIEFAIEHQGWGKVLNDYEAQEGV